MKNLLVLTIILAVAFASFALADQTKMTAKVGDELYVCGCGNGCTCDTMSRSPAKCSCGKDLVKSKVARVEEGQITMDVRSRPFVSIAKYACSCGSNCKCDTISQKSGDCACGMKLAEVKTK